MTPIIPYVFVLPVISGLLSWLSSPAFPYPLAVWVCLVPLGLSLYRASPEQGFTGGFIYGFCFWLAVAWWLKIQLISMVHLPPLQAWSWTAVFCAVHALPYAFFGYLAAKFRLMESHPGTLFAAVALAVIRTWYPHVFPGSEANYLYSWPLLIQVLDLGGTPLLLFCVYLVNFQIVRAFTARRSQESWVPALISIVVVFSLLAGYGGWRLHELRGQIKTANKGQQITVLSIQPNVPVNPNNPGEPLLDRREDLKTLEVLSVEGSRRYRSADLVVWPEIPFAFDCRDEANRDVPLLTQLTGRAFLLPCISVIGDGGKKNSYNSVTFIDKNGNVGEEYRKLILVPFGEYIPLERQFPFLRKIFPGVMTFTAGDRGPVLYNFGEGRRLIPSLCYEAIFTEHTRRFVRRGGNILVNMVDDAWFGESPASVNHLSMALYRTVEYRIPLVRVTNSGVGVFVQPTGEIVPGSETPLFQKAAAAYTLYIPHERSFYGRFGDAFLYGLTVFFVLGLAYYSLRHYKLAGKKILRRR